MFGLGKKSGKHASVDLLRMGNLPLVYSQSVETVSKALIHQVKR